MTAAQVVSAQQPVSAQREDAGHLADGTAVEAIALTNASGISARILTYGATLQVLLAPDAEGALADIILGHDDVADYEQSRAFLGATIGRYANRIAGGRFTLDGVAYQLAQNDGPHCLHSGDQGFDRVVWSIDAVTEGAEASVVLSHVSADGEGGFPGEVRASVTYALDTTGDLTITMTATTSRPTILAMTNHALFNLAGDGAWQGAMLHRLAIPAAAFTPVDAQCIPTGQVAAVAGTVFDFRDGRIVAAGLRCGNDPQIGIGRG